MENAGLAVDWNFKKTFKARRKLLQEEKQISILQWPSQSQDLNPSENRKGEHSHAKVFEYIGA